MKIRVGRRTLRCQRVPRHYCCSIEKADGDSNKLVRMKSGLFSHRYWSAPHATRGVTYLQQQKHQHQGTTLTCNTHATSRRAGTLPLHIAPRITQTNTPRVHTYAHTRPRRSARRSRTCLSLSWRCFRESSSLSLASFFFSFCTSDRFFSSYIFPCGGLVVVTSRQCFTAPDGCVRVLVAPSTPPHTRQSTSPDQAATAGRKTWNRTSPLIQLALPPTAVTLSKNAINFDILQRGQPRRTRSVYNNDTPLKQGHTHMNLDTYILRRSRNTPTQPV